MQLGFSNMFCSHQSLKMMNMAVSPVKKWIFLSAAVSSPSTLHMVYQTNSFGTCSMQPAAKAKRLLNLNTQRQAPLSFSHLHKCKSINAVPKNSHCDGPLHSTSFKHFHTGCVTNKNISSDTPSSNSTADSTTTTSSYPTLPAQSADTLIETWFYTVAPRGALNLNLPFTTVVRPLNPQSHPDMDKVIIEIHFDEGCGEEVPASHELSRIGELYSLDVTFDKDAAKMNVTGSVTPGVGLPLVCMLWVPLQSDLYAAVGTDKDLTVERLEGNKINLTADSGNCNLKSLKCGSISVQCRAGDINSKSTLLGNAILQTGMKGSINADKLQGSSVICETEMGSMCVKSLYADTTVVRTTGGPISLGQCHGQLLLQAAQSDIKVESLEGDIDVGIHSGNVDVHLSRHSETNIDVQNGDIKLSFPEGVNTDVNLDSSKVTIGENIAVTFVETDQPHHKEGYIGKQGVASVHARTLSGTIDVKLLDWIHTTKLAFQLD